MVTILVIFNKSNWFYRSLRKQWKLGQIVVSFLVIGFSIPAKRSLARLLSMVWLLTSCDSPVQHNIWFICFYFKLILVAMPELMCETSNMIGIYHAICDISHVFLFKMEIAIRSLTWCNFPWWNDHSKLEQSGLHIAECTLMPAISCMILNTFSVVLSGFLPASLEISWDQCEIWSIHNISCYPSGFLIFHKKDHPHVFRHSVNLVLAMTMSFFIHLRRF